MAGGLLNVHWVDLPRLSPVLQIRRLAARLRPFEVSTTFCVGDWNFVAPDAGGDMSTSAEAFDDSAVARTFCDLVPGFAELVADGYSRRHFRDNSCSLSRIDKGLHERFDTLLASTGRHGQVLGQRREPPARNRPCPYPRLPAASPAASALSTRSCRRRSVKYSTGGVGVGLAGCSLCGGPRRQVICALGLCCASGGGCTLVACGADGLAQTPIATSVGARSAHSGASSSLRRFPRRLSWDLVRGARS